MIKAVIFDYDGTLRDTREILFSSIEHSFSKLGVVFPGRDKILPYIHHHSFVVEKFAPEITLEEFEAVYEPKVQDELGGAGLYRGVDTILRKLKDNDIKLGMVTAAKSAKIDLDNHEIGTHFDVIITPNEVKSHKPNPEGINLALDRLGVSAEQALYIGDLPTDMQAGIAAHLRSNVGIAHGLGTREALIDAGADYVIDSLDELIKVIGLTE